jgi:hypothetical protein
MHDTTHIVVGAHFAGHAVKDSAGGMTRVTMVAPYTFMHESHIAWPSMTCEYLGVNRRRLGELLRTGSGDPKSDLMLSGATECGRRRRGMAKRTGDPDWIELRRSDGKRSSPVAMTRLQRKREPADRQFPAVRGGRVPCKFYRCRVKFFCTAQVHA